MSGQHMTPWCITLFAAWLADLDMRVTAEQQLQLHSEGEDSELEQLLPEDKSMPFGNNLMRSHLLCWAIQELIP